jgi:hypothetical protein
MMVNILMARELSEGVTICKIVCHRRTESYSLPMIEELTE